MDPMQAFVVAVVVAIGKGKTKALYTGLESGTNHLHNHQQSS